MRSQYGPAEAASEQALVHARKAEDSHEEARRSISALRPEHLESVGLLSALDECARRMVSQSSAIEIKSQVRGTVQNTPLRVSDTLLRIGYEAIANVVRHSHCSQLTITLVYSRSAVEMIVEDNGLGFIVSSDSAGFGIRRSFPCARGPG